MDTRVRDGTMSGLGNLIKLLPTGTVFLFQFLSPVLTNDGNCKTNNKYYYFSGALLGVCGLSCFFSTFTDSYKDDSKGIIHGIATRKGLWLSSATSVDLSADSAYKLRLGDFVHAYFSLLVFAVVAFLDRNTRECFFPSWHSEDLLQALPIVVGAVSGVVFALYPSTRHGIGYPLSPSSTDGSKNREENLDHKV